MEQSFMIFDVFWGNGKEWRPPNGSPMYHSKEPLLDLAHPCFPNSNFWHLNSQSDGCRHELWNCDNFVFSKLKLLTFTTTNLNLMDVLWIVILWQFHFRQTQAFYFWPLKFQSDGGCYELWFCDNFVFSRLKLFTCEIWWM